VVWRRGWCGCAAVRDGGAVAVSGASSGGVHRRGRVFGEVPEDDVADGQVRVEVCEPVGVGVGEDVWAASVDEEVAAAGWQGCAVGEVLLCGDLAGEAGEVAESAVGAGLCDSFALFVEGEGEPAVCDGPDPVVGELVFQFVGAGDRVAVSGVDGVDQLAAECFHLLGLFAGCTVVCEGVEGLVETGLVEFSQGDGGVGWPVCDQLPEGLGGGHGEAFLLVGRGPWRGVHRCCGWGGGNWGVFDGPGCGWAGMFVCGVRTVWGYG